MQVITNSRIDFDFKDFSVLNWCSIVLLPLYYAIWAFNRSFLISTTPKYPDFIVGYPTLQNVAKVQDIISVLVFCLVFILIFFCFSFFIKLLKQKNGKTEADLFSASVLCWLSPMFVVLSKYIFSNTFDFDLFVVFYVPLTVFILFSVILFIKGTINIKQVNALVITLLFVTLLPSVISLVADRLLDYTIPIDKIEQASNIVFVLFFVVTLLFLMLKRINLPQSFLIAKVLLLSQFILLGFYVALFPSTIRETNLGDFQYQTTSWLAVLVLFLVALGILDIVYRYKRYIKTNKDCSIFKLFSPVAIFGLLIMIKFPGTVYPQISTDDYHFGEYLLGFWSFIEAGYVPYKDFVPAHGLIMNYFPDLVNYLFYDGSAGSLIQARNLSRILIAFVAFMAINKYYKNVGLAFVIILVFLVSLVNWLVLIPFTLLFINRKLIDKPEWWISLWILLAPVVFLLVPAQGLGLIVGSGFIGLYCLYQLKNKEKIEWLQMIIALGALSLLLIFTSLFSMMAGAFDYVFSNSKINQLAYGINWATSVGMSECPAFLFEFFRNSWIWVLVLVSLYTVKRFISFSIDQLSVISTGLFFIVFILLMIPYAMGRIDPFVISRPGFTSIFFIVLVIPALFWNNNLNRQVLIIVILILVSSGLGKFPDCKNNFKSNLRYQSSTPELIDFRHSPLSNIGVAFVEPNQLARLQKLADVLNKEIEPENTYWDLTNSIATYRYLNYLPATSIIAPYNQPSTKDQIRSVDQIENKKINHLLIDHYGFFDGVAFALRNPFNFRYIMTHFNFDQRSGLLMGFRKDSVTFNHQVGLADLSDSNWDQGINYKYNILLFENNVFNDAKLEKAAALAYDEDTIQINKVEKSSSWIHVLTDNLLDNYTSTYNVVYKDEKIAKERISRLNLLYMENTPYLTTRDLSEIPNAWAQSIKSLMPKLRDPYSLDNLPAITNDLLLEQGDYTITGNNPFIQFNLETSDICSDNAGILFLKLIPDKTISNFNVSVSYNGSFTEGSKDEHTFTYSSRRVAALIPFDSQPGWHMMQNIKTIRFALEGLPVGTKFTLKEVTMFDRY